MSQTSRPSSGPSPVSLPLLGEEPPVAVPEVAPTGDSVTIDPDAVSDFRTFLQQNKDALKTGMGAFHTDNHSNW